MKELTDNERVAIVAARLDRVLPGWHRHITVSRLDMCDGTSCVAGQLDAWQNVNESYPSYSRFARWMADRLTKRLRKQLGLEHGLRAYQDEHLLAFGTTGKTAWISEIRARRQLDRAKAASV